MADCVISVDLGGTQLRVALCSTNCHMVARHAEPSRADEGLEAVIGRIVAGVRVMGDEVGWDKVSAVGLSVPGPVDPRRGLVWGRPTCPAGVMCPSPNGCAGRSTGRCSWATMPTWRPSRSSATVPARARPTWCTSR